jgi:hypothetical protein
MSMLAEQVDGVIGVDTHRDTLAAAAVSSLGAVLAHAEAATDAHGYFQLLEFAREHVCSSTPDTELKKIRRYKLIIVDEVGFIPFDQDAANLFFQLVASRYEAGG